MTHPEAPENIDSIRQQLTETRLTEFVDSLINNEDHDATRENLVSIISKTLAALLDVEREFVVDVFKEAAESDICPGCLANATADLVRVETIAREFNAYVSSPGVLGGSECE